MPLPGSSEAAGGAPPGGEGRGRLGDPGQGGIATERTNWDAPYIISPHSPKRLYWGSNFLYRSEDRGDTWERISPDLSRHLDPAKVPIMGKLWVPAETVSWNQATTALSNIVTIDESPLLEGLLYVGTDDGLLQVSEDRGKSWRRVDSFPSVPEGTYVTDVFASPRNADLVFVALNNWQRGDFKPYLLKSADRGRTFISIAGDLPDRQDVFSVVQDHVNGDLLFAGTEFGLFFTVDGGQRWVRLRGGLPTIQVRDLAVQKRENDMVLGTFGRRHIGSISCPRPPEGGPGRPRSMSSAPQVLIRYDMSPSPKSSHTFGLGATVTQNEDSEMRFIREDMLDLSFAAETLDGAIAYYSIIHTPKVAVGRFFREFHRVLKPGGLLLVAVKAGLDEGYVQELLSIPAEVYFALFHEREIRDYFEEAGFAVDFLERRDPYGFEIKNERIFAIGRKAAGKGGRIR